MLLIYRTFKRYRSSFFINLIGLSAGLSCVLLIYLWVNDEVQIDHFHAKAIYQVMKNENITDGINTGEETPAILAEAMTKEFPEVELAVTVSPTYWLQGCKISVNKNPAVKAAGRLAGPDFFKVFSYPLTAGSADNVLKEKNTAVVSETLAKKLFGTADVIGKELTWSNADFKSDNHVLISGVFKDTPANSSDQFDFLISLDALFTSSPNFLKWGSNLPGTYVVLKKGANVANFSARIKDFLTLKGEKTNTLFIRSFADRYLYNHFENGVVVGGRIDYVKLFSIIAVFILIIACINFMNLSTAKASRRLKEVGIKKVMGAQRGSLILQYMAVFLSLLMVELLLPQFNNLVGKELKLQFSGTLVVSLLAITIFTGLASGSYPALYLSGLKAVTALKGKLNLSSGALWTRQGLVVFQFTLSIILIVAVLVVYKQIEYIATYNPGFILDLKFLDQDFQAQYLAETRISTLSRYFALLAVVISCLGLFGLATFTAERRLKEIGIRKVLGASRLNVIFTLSKDFTKPVLISILIALPIGYLLCKNWLDSFAYRIDLQLWFFMVAGFLALLISLVTVFYQAIKASRVSPVVAIKAE